MNKLVRAAYQTHLNREVKNLYLDWWRQKPIYRKMSLWMIQRELDSLSFTKKAIFRIVTAFLDPYPYYHDGWETSMKCSLGIER